jgi:pyridoxal phosphate enzyme (YggS family)
MLAASPEGGGILRFARAAFRPLPLFMTRIPAASFAERLAAVQQRVGAAAQRAGRNAARVRILAVAKTARAPDLLEAWTAGQRCFAHNRAQALARDASLLPQAEWHMIGPVQGNKVTECARLAAVVQTVGESKTAARLDRAAALAGRRLPVLLQANPQPADGRYGCPMDGLAALALEVQALPHLELRGLMAIGALDAAECQLRASFGGLRAQAEELVRAGLLPPDPEISCGMSEDFEIAVEEGANLVRIGRLLFPPTAEGANPDPA